MTTYFVHALDCGHRTWTGATASSGIAWCETCGRYVGVIVLRKDTP